MNRNTDHSNWQLVSPGDHHLKETRMNLRISRGEEVLGDLDLAEGEYVIGSGESADLRIESDYLAPEHARLRVGRGRVEVEDLGSGCESWIGELSLSGTRSLPRGSVLRLGDISVQVADDDDGFEDEPSAELPDEEDASGRYVIGPVLASGNMGVIRSAREVLTGREVAMKQMKPGTDNPMLVARFVREAKVAAHMEHPNIVPVYDVSVGGREQSYYTMKMIRGATLEDLLTKIAEGDAATAGKYRLDALLTIFQKICDGVAFAHSRGIIHRDLKPANTMVGEYGEVMVMDWGLAKIAGEAASIFAEEGLRGFADAPGELSQDGAIMGTPYYMSPEQATGELDAVDERSDVYSLGGILYTLLTFQRPVEGKGTYEVLSNVIAGRITPPLQRVREAALRHLPGGKVPNALNAVVMKAMARSPEHRYASAAGLQADVAAYVSGRATGAEQAGLGRQVALLVGRHKAAFAVGTVAVATLVAVATGLLTNLSKLMTNLGTAKEDAKKATDEAERSQEAAKTAKAEAESAAVKAKLAEEAATEAGIDAQIKGRLATANEAKAKAAEEAARKAKEEADRKTEEADRKTDEALLAQCEEHLAKHERERANQETYDARRQKADERLAKRAGKAEAAAQSGDSATVLINSLSLIADPLAENAAPAMSATGGMPAQPGDEMITVHRRRIRAALGQMPRLVSLFNDAAAARISPNGSLLALFSRGQKQNTVTILDRQGLFAKFPAIRFQFPIAGRLDGAEFDGNSRYLFAAYPTTDGRSAVQLWDTEARDFVRYSVTPSISGKLERFLPFPDRSKVVTVHTLDGPEKKKAISVWDLNSPAASRADTPSVKGLVWALAGDSRPNNFNIQTFQIGGAADGVYRLAPVTTGMAISPVNPSPLKSATAMSPDGTRAVQLYLGELSLAGITRDAGGNPGRPLALHVSSSVGARANPLRKQFTQRQKLVDVRNSGAPPYEDLIGGESAFSPDSKWLLMGADERAVLHDVSDPARKFPLKLPGQYSRLTFSGDSSLAIVSTEVSPQDVATEGELPVYEFWGASIGFWNTLGRKVCPDLLFKSEPTEFSFSRDGRFVVATGEYTTLWDTAPAGTRAAVDFKDIREPGNCAIWVSTDGRRAVTIPRPWLTKNPLLPEQQPVLSNLKVTISAYDLEAGVRRSIRSSSQELSPAVCCWLTGNGRFFLWWGGGAGPAKVWDLQESNQPRDIFHISRAVPVQYRHIVNGRGIVVVESATDSTIGLVVARGTRPIRNAQAEFFFDGITSELLKSRGSLAAKVKSANGIPDVPDLDGSETIAAVATRLRREKGTAGALPEDARRAFYSADAKLVAVLCTSATDRAAESQVMSSLVFDSDLLGMSPEQLANPTVAHDYGIIRQTLPKARDWRLFVYDVATGAPLLGNVTLPSLAAFRWEGHRCVALSCEGRWTEIDLTPDERPIEELSDISLLLTGRAIDRGSGTIAATQLPAATLAATWARLSKKYSDAGLGWQTGGPTRVAPRGR
jgi:WD40 repeat protein